MERQKEAAIPLACPCPACAPVQGRLDGTEPAGDAISSGEIAPGESAPGTTAAAPSVAGGAEGADEADLFAEEFWVEGVSDW